MQTASVAATSPESRSRHTEPQRLGHNAGTVLVVVIPGVEIALAPRLGLVMTRHELKQQAAVEAVDLHGGEANP